MTRAPNNSWRRAGLVAVLAGWACLAGAADPLRVAVSIPPQKYLVEQVGGNRVAVQVLLPPGAAPETFQLTPRQVMQLAKVDLYCCIGIPFEQQCLDRILPDRPELVTLHMSDGLARLPGPVHHGHDHSHPDHAHDAPDPHVWTSPVLLQQMTGKLATTLAEIDPENADQYAANAAELTETLQRLDRDLHDRFTQVRIRSFLVAHPAWSYLARDYDLEQIPIEQDGKSPGPRGVASLVDRARSLGIRTVFTDPQFSANEAEVIARELDATVVGLDPLAEQVVDNLAFVGKALAGAMQ